MEYETGAQFARAELLFGKENMERLRNARVAVFGVGGVGGYAVEALARGGVGTLDLIDDDKVSVSNINRQIIAVHSTIGQYKVDAAKARVLDINPRACVNVYRTFYLPETAGQFDFTKYDYVVDAIDTVTGKLMLAEQANAAGVPLISAMGAGNKLDAGAFEVTDISRTSVCPLAKVMRRELKKRGITHLKVVYSKEAPLTPLSEHSTCLENMEETAAQKNTRQEMPETGGKSVHPRRQTPGSTSFVPPVVGLMIAGEVIRDLTNRA